jgi:hypothetical protein
LTYHRTYPFLGRGGAAASGGATSFDARSYADLIQTQGDHRLLPPDRLAALVAAVEDVIDRAGGGHIEYVFSTDLSIAKPSVAGGEVPAVINDSSAHRGTHRSRSSKRIVYRGHRVAERALVRRDRREHAVVFALQATWAVRVGVDVVQAGSARWELRESAGR